MAKAQDVAKLAYALIDLYIVEYTARFSRKPDVNRFKSKYGFQDMVNDLGYEKSQKVVKHYVSSNRPSITINDLLYNYDKINSVIEQIEEDNARKAILRAETKARVEEWEAKNGKR
jgi:hypothetical protein